MHLDVFAMRAIGGETPVGQEQPLAEFPILNAVERS